MNIPELLAQYETRLLKDKLLEYPGMIQKQKAILRKAREAYTDAAQTVAMYEADLATDIAAEVDPATGKPRFSNDKTRQAELMRRKGVNSDYAEAARLAREAEFIANELQDELDAMWEKLKSYRYVVEMTTAELYVWANKQRQEENGGAKEKAAAAQAY